MTVTKTRGAGKKLGQTGLGRKITYFTIESIDRRFTIHEDLICASSKLFKRRLQKKRKEVEGECTICHEALDSMTSDITFCRKGCGQNIHRSCYEKWSLRQKTCPMCRGAWVEAPEPTTELDSALNPTDVDKYIQWLYSKGTLSLVDSPSSKDTPIIEEGLGLYRKALRQHTIGLTIKDKDFAAAAARSFLQYWHDDKLTYRLDVLVAQVYKDVAIRKESRRILVDAYLTKNVFGQFSQYVSKYPRKFLEEVACAFMEKNGPELTIAEVLEKHTACEQGVDDEIDDDDSEDDFEDEFEDDEV